MSVRVIGGAPEQTLARVEKLSYWLNHLYAALGLLIIAGLAASFTTTVYFRLALGRPPYADVIQHAAFSAAGLVIVFGLTYLISASHPARRWLRIAIPLVLFSSLVLVALVKFSPLGVSDFGARRWLDLGFVKFQPSELLKVSIVMYLGQLLCWWRRTPAESEAEPPRRREGWRNHRETWKHSLEQAERADTSRLETLERMLASVGVRESWLRRVGLAREGRPSWPELPKRCALIILLAVGLTAIQPDLGTTGLILGVGFVTIILAGTRLRDILALLAVIVFIVACGMLLAPEMYAYADKRVSTWLNPLANDDDAGYQITQSRGALAVGGVFGQGFLRSEQKMNRLPLATKDFVYPVIVEELGLVGGLGVIVLFLYLAWVGLMLAQFCRDYFNQVVIASLGLAVTLQALVNIGTTLGTLPLSGLPLPFLSNGGTSLLVSIGCIGLMIALARSEIVEGDRELERVFGR